MPVEDPIARILQSKAFVVLDGALATELETRGCDLNHPLWSAKILHEDPKAIFDVHLDYFKAGADVAITASYQASIPGLKDYLQHNYSAGHANDLIAQSVHLAQEARDKYFSGSSYGDCRRTLLIAGSVGPYGAYLADGSEYRGDYKLATRAMKDFHRGRIRVLVDEHVDLLACETMPSYAELSALVSLLRDEFPDTPAWVSCTLRDSTHISDGTPIADVVALLNKADNVIAIGVNCVEQQMVHDALVELHRLTTKPLVAYPNSGERYDASSKTWCDNCAGREELGEVVPKWYAGGARLIGGCCRTTPKDTLTVRLIADRLTKPPGALESVEEDADDESLDDT
ncbi:homocysteine methyltransferase [Pseudovirgaria hyperparasitica]|uniref:Homocysteine methyltransferase n=1 Tax=Pseudovirgaria hyperparasitica TaxID=470096 RepID=A0A6A6WF35_9PEZI|nr:homocysteine methyltransferase [Pseudovirgaria hyperparasitica]KAF2760769.1 homocysteine methyltransferase [Pseudovirgaria hyperparasitica]